MLTPYFTGLAVAWAPPVNRLVTSHLFASTSLGWLALATVFAGVFAVRGHPGMAMAIASAPLVGLAFWTTASGPDDDGPPPPPDDVPPAPDAVGTTRVRLPGPARTRPTGHRESPRSRIPARSR